MISRGHSWGLAYFPDVSYRDTYLANPMSDNQFMLASGNAVLRHLFQRTVMLVDTNDLPYAERRWITFSGTLIRIGDRIFVATVSHTLENVENPTRYSLMAMTGHSATTQTCERQSKLRSRDLFRQSNHLMANTR